MAQFQSVRLQFFSFFAEQELLAVFVHTKQNVHYINVSAKELLALPNDIENSQIGDLKRHISWQFKEYVTGTNLNQSILVKCTLKNVVLSSGKDQTINLRKVVHYRHSTP